MDMLVWSVGTGITKEHAVSVFREEKIAVSWVTFTWGEVGGVQEMSVIAQQEIWKIAVGKRPFCGARQKKAGQC